MHVPRGRLHLRSSCPRVGRGSARRRRPSTSPSRRSHPVRGIDLEAPEVIEAECVDGEATEPSVEPVETEGVEYDLAPAGPWQQGDSVTVTATITDPEAGWADPLADGWNVVDPATATYEVTFEVIECAAASSTTTSPSTTAASTTVGPSASTRRRRRVRRPPRPQRRRRSPRPRRLRRRTTAAPTTAPAAPGNVVVTGNAVCAPDAGQTTLTWTVRNIGGSPVTITGDDRGVSFTPTQLPANTSATGSEVIEGPAADEAVTETVSVDVGGGQTAEAAATMTVPACTGPAAPDDIVFTFTNEPSVRRRPRARRSRTTTAARTPATSDLEVVRVVDDRYGVLELPAGETVVAPGETICSSDLGLPVTHVPTAAEEGRRSSTTRWPPCAPSRPSREPSRRPTRPRWRSSASSRRSRRRRQRPCRSLRWPTPARTRWRNSSPALWHSRAVACCC